MDKPVEEFISAVLDITAVKPLIECCTGYDMITGEDLSDFERGMKGVSAVVSLFTLGQGSIVMNGGKLALGETVKMEAKMLAVDAISTGVAYGTSEICQAMGCPGGLTLVLSLLAGMGTSAGLGSKVFGNGGLTPDDVAYQRYWDEGVSEVFESGSEIQTIHNRFPNEIQSGRRFNYSIDNGKIYLENGIQEVDFVIDMNGNLHLGRGHSALANGADVQAAGTMKINSQGYVRTITNASGHYTPTVTQGKTFPSLLDQLGIRTKNAWLELGDYCLTQSGYVDLTKSTTYVEQLK